MDECKNECEKDVFECYTGCKNDSACISDCNAQVIECEKG